jgi:hypothetical protein
MYGSYIRKVVDSSNDNHGMATAIALNAATGNILTKSAREPMCVERFGFAPTVAFDYATQTRKGVLTLYKYPGGDTSKKVALATINLEDGDVPGTQYVVDVDNQPVKAAAPYTGVQSKNVADIDPGDQVGIEITTQGAGGAGIAGTYQPFFCWHERPETENNMAKLVNRTPVKATADSNIHA